MTRLQAATENKTYREQRVKASETAYARYGGAQLWKELKDAKADLLKANERLARATER